MHRGSELGETGLGEVVRERQEEERDLESWCF